MVEGPFDEILYRDIRYRSRRISENIAGLESILNELVEVNFLSVHRGSFNKYGRDEEFATVIDKTVSDLSVRFSSYFSLLTTKINEKSKSFQEFVFLKLLEPSPNEMINIIIGEDDKKKIIDVLIDLGFSRAKATKSVNGYANRLRQAITSKEFSVDEIGTIVDSRRIEAIIGKWKEIDEEKKNILNPKKQFEDIINGLLTRKSVGFD
ncbi:hypothetical protein AD937_05420 [Gluconobacter japonicus]|nr:hypothetical protein AD937_05420 [Gluconobacter japonicus]